jgi:hypothetical protein
MRSLAADRRLGPARPSGASRTFYARMECCLWLRSILLALMAKVLQALGTALMTLPVGSSSPGRTTGFAFEMHYVMGNMTPHREPAWALLAERARTLAHRCSEVAAEASHHADLSAVTGEAAARAHAIADALTAQVPAELRPEPDQAIRL